MPLFSKVRVTLGDGSRFTVVRKGNGRRISSIMVGGKKLDGWFVRHEDLLRCGTITVGVD